jgi:hypothetical protein
MSTSDQRSSCDDEPRTVRTVAAAVKFAEPASQVAGWPRRCETSGVQWAWGEKQRGNPLRPPNAQRIRCWAGAP